MLTLAEATRRLLTRAQVAGEEEVPLAAAAGRVLADPRIVATRDVPAFANSAMDGYAVRAADTPGTLSLAGEVPAGAAMPPELTARSAVRIMTGAPLPPGADAVIPLEQAREDDGRVTLEMAQPGAFVRSAGSDTPAGSEVCLPSVLGPAAIAVLASLGQGTVLVRRRPRVAILSTGDELVEPGEPLRPGQIYDTNTLALAAALVEAGGEPMVMGHAADTPAAVGAGLKGAVGRAELVVVSGGVSVGRYDYVREILERDGSLDFWRIAVQPGKPLAVGTFNGTTVIGLPGNPVSALVTFELFVRPFIRAALGLTGDGRLRVQARPDRAIPKDVARRAFLRVSVERQAGDFLARPSGGQGSAQLRSLADANALLVVPEGDEAAEPERHYEAIVIGELL